MQLQQVLLRVGTPFYSSPMSDLYAGRADSFIK